MNKQSLEFRDLGSLGVPWVRGALASGKILSRQVIAGIDFEQGSAVALGISDVRPVPDIDSLRRASASSGLQLDIETSARSLVNLLRRLEAQAGSLLVVVESGWEPWEPASPAPRQSPQPGSSIIADQVIYAFIGSPDLATVEDAIAFLGMNGSYWLQAFVFRSISPSDLRQALESRSYESLTGRLDAIITSIFDNDGYAVWMPAHVMEPV